MAPTAHVVPIAFISYSWDSEDHCEWVEELATELSSAGIQIILDKWDLEPGHDKYYFMERSVTDSNFVLLICTPHYAQKANARSGGGGYEATIITSELAGNVRQTKFVPILRSGDWETGLPLWIRSRLGFDFRDDSDRAVRRKLLQHLRGASDVPPPAAPHSGSPSPARATRQLLVALGEVEEYLKTGLMNQVQQSSSFGGEDMIPVHAAADVLVRVEPFLKEPLAKSARLALASLQDELNVFLAVLGEAIAATGEQRRTAERKLIEQQRQAWATFSGALGRLKELG